MATPPHTKFTTSLRGRTHFSIKKCSPKPPQSSSFSSFVRSRIFLPLKLLRSSICAAIWRKMQPSPPGNIQFSPTITVVAPVPILLHSLPPPAHLLLLPPLFFCYISSFPQNFCPFFDVFHVWCMTRVQHSATFRQNISKNTLKNTWLDDTSPCKVFQMEFVGIFQVTDWLGTKRSKLTVLHCSEFHLSVYDWHKETPFL